MADLHRWFSEDIGVPHCGSDRDSEQDGDEEEDPQQASAPSEWRFDD